MGEGEDCRYTWEEYQKFYEPFLRFEEFPPSRHRGEFDKFIDASKTQDAIEETDCVAMEVIRCANQKYYVVYKD
jgi:hypothetical protein